MMPLQVNPHREEQEDLLVEEDVSGGYAIILYNDDVNTFDWVIESLIELCDHTAIQAEQCAMIVHYKGKCAVKHGDYEALEPICNALCNRDLSAAVELV
jgi:ATP-dependent Clp protease adaptor protein ClpS